MAKSPRQQLLEEAIKITTSDRNKQYGNPEDNFRNIADLWYHYFKAQGQDVKINSADVAIMMALMKIARLSTNPTHHDSALDVAGYMACLADIQASMKKSSLLDNLMTQPTQDIPGVRFPNSDTK